MGGIFGEGVDLVGDRLIGCAIVGVGLPQVNPRQEMLRRYYEEQSGCGFDYAYRYPGMNKVLQAAGRVVRTPQDKGVVLLLDDRFAQPDTARLFPPHWQHIQYLPVPPRWKRRWQRFGTYKTAKGVVASCATTPFAITLILHALPCGNTLLVGVATAAHLCEVICGVQHPRGAAWAVSTHSCPAGRCSTACCSRALSTMSSSHALPASSSTSISQGCASAAARFWFCKSRVAAFSASFI